MKHRCHVNVRHIIDGPIIRVIDGISSDGSSYTVACKLMAAGEHDLTVLIRANGKAGQFLTGRLKGGWYCGQGKHPEDSST
ncbi:hypothetical protein ES703_78408 [subsurface metagenome]